MMLWKHGLGRAVAVVTSMVIVYGTVAGMVSIAFRPIGVSESTLLLASTFTLLVGGMIGAIACYSGTQLVISRDATISMLLGLVVNLLVVPTSNRSDIARTIGQAGGLGLLTTSVLAIGLTGLCWHISQLVLADSDQHRLFKRLAIAWSSLGNICFYKADLTGANFAGASLKGADFRGAKLDYVNWRGATGLKWARWGEDQLSDKRVVELLTRDPNGKANYSDVDLSFTDLEGVDLSYLNLSGANFIGAVLRGTNLEGAILRDVRAVGTDFTGARFTGACIENWSIDASTKLQQVDCRFVFLQEFPKPGTNSRDRQPASGEFEPGDFEQLYQTVIDTFELIFRNGLDWKTFQASLDEVRQANPTAHLRMQSVETKGDGYVVVKLRAEGSESKAQLYQEVWQAYLERIRVLEGTYQQAIADKQNQLDDYKAQNQTLLEITRQLAQSSIQRRPATGEAVILSLPQGSLATGFTVLAQVWNAEQTLMRTQIGALPPNPELAQSYQRWRRLYQAQQPLFADSFASDTPTNFSQVEFEQAARQVLTQMNAWLQSPIFLPIDQCLRAVLDPHQPATLTWQVDDVAVQQLPLHCWHFFDDYPNTAITFSFLNTRAVAAHPPQRQRQRVLSVLGIDSGLDVEADKKILESMPDVDACCLVQPTVQQLTETLWQADGWDIFCFSGHSAFEGDRLWLNEQEFLSLDDLKYALRQATQQGLSLSIFNCCQGLQLARQFANVASTGVIVMREPVPDKVAQIFLQYLLAGLQTEMTTAHALKKACEQLQGLEMDFPYTTWLPLFIAHL
ncbi:MAG: pentapeptide repeat-containing protein [Leptolyngbya sp. SIO1E4]|nr:pentapeptide repeat-containing protein [Leptolyngbya sp. SIO1E4]